MKIRKNIQASEELCQDTNVSECQFCEPSDSCEVDPKEAARNHVKIAIDELCKVAKEDEIAKESIANLAVVLVDLM